MLGKLTIALKDVVCDGISHIFNKGCVGKSVEKIVHQHVLDTTLDDGYRAMAADITRETEAQEWCNAQSK